MFQVLFVENQMFLSGEEKNVSIKVKLMNLTQENLNSYESVGFPSDLFLVVKLNHEIISIQ